MERKARFALLIRSRTCLEKQIPRLVKVSPPLPDFIARVFVVFIVTPLSDEYFSSGALLLGIDSRPVVGHRIVGVEQGMDDIMTVLNCFVKVAQ